MIKLTFLMKRKDGMSFADFQRYYEENHAPLAAAQCAGLVRYRRTYVTGTQPMARNPSASEAGFDCITECWYDVEGSWEERSRDLLPPDVFRRMAADEENFLDRSATRLLFVEECESTAETLAGNRN